jgi:glycosyltransferase involved in cell wall biosynthesis
MNQYAIILTHNRPELLRDCIAAIGPQIERIVVIDNASEPPVRAADLPMDGLFGCILGIPTQPPNLAALWNRGLDTIYGWHRYGSDPDGPCWIAVLCDDAIVPGGWFAAVTDAMAQTGAAAGCSNPWGTEHEPRLKTTPDSDLMGRMPGWAFILDGSKGLRADESMHWWWCDTDLDWQARAAGGMVMIGGFPVPNRLPNDFLTTVPGLNEQAGRDGEAFAAKWSWRPW